MGAKGSVRRNKRHNFGEMDRIIYYVTFFAAAGFHLGVKGITETGISEQSTCYPTDYVRSSSPCNSATGMRTVTYTKSRNCSDPFPVPTEGHQEPCSCTPLDYGSTYEFDQVKKICELKYTPQNCTNGKLSAPEEVSIKYCGMAPVPCSSDHIHTSYTECNYLRNETNAVIGGTLEVIYYFSGDCSPSLPGSVRLPPNDFMPCDVRCEAGTYLQGEKCLKCPNGTYSTGGGTRMEVFEMLDSQYFKTNCTFWNGSGLHTCDGWRAEGGSLVVGPYDKPNHFLPSECDTDVNKQCHNKLTSTLTMSVRLVRDGFVKFNYTVNAEDGYDGLSFYVDMNTVPAMELHSYEFDSKQMQFKLMEGFHELRWEFSKDYKWTLGADTAAISLIEVDGTNVNDHDCLPCPAGYYSGEGASACTPCARNFFTASQRSSTCSACLDDQYTLKLPRTTCQPRPACNVNTDATVTFGPCSAKTKTRTKTYSWLEPQVCAPIAKHQLPRPLTENCPPCPLGQQAVTNKSDNTLVCQLCSPGEVRADGEEACHNCDDGQVALRQLTLAHFDSANVNDMAGVASGCSGDCGTDGWRSVNGYLDSGVGHGNSVSVWIIMKVNLVMDGFVQYNYSVDIPQGDRTRGLFFYIDHTTNDAIMSLRFPNGLVPAGPRMSASHKVPAGNHTLAWLYQKLNAYAFNGTRDSAIIYDIFVTGEVRGGPYKCQSVPPGAEALKSNDAWVDCEPGKFSTGNASKCEDCPADTYNPEPLGGSGACKPCGPGTGSLPGAAECTVGNPAVPTSFCTYSPPDTGPTDNTTEASARIIYDLSPLDRLHPGKMFGPVDNDLQAPVQANEAKFFVSVCSKAWANDTCIDELGQPLNTYLCRVAEKGGSYQTDLRPAMDLGKFVTVNPLGDHPATQKRGLIMTFKGGPCDYGGLPRSTNVTFVCDPGSGYGEPEPWHSNALTRVLNPRAPFPWATRSGTPLKVGRGGYAKCEFALVWFSMYACPLCSEADYEAVDIKDCAHGVKTTYNYKQPKICQDNPQVPLPKDELCQACTRRDYEEDPSTCLDSQGLRNITYRWIQPRNCSTEMPGATALPANVVAGACVQSVTVQGGLTWWQWILAVLGAILIVVLAALYLFTYLKNKRLYNAYSKLVENERAADFSLDDEDSAGNNSPPL